MVNLQWSVLAIALAFGFFTPAIGAAPSTTADVVEGHTTYVELTVNEAPEYSLIGDLECHFEVNRIRVDVPPSVASVVADCLTDVTVFAHGDGTPDPRDYNLAATGRHAEVTDNNDITWQVTEYAYTAPHPDTGAMDTFHTWTVPAAGPHVDPDTGTQYSFAITVDPAKLPQGATVAMVAGSPPGV